MLLHLQTWPEVETYLKRSTAIIVPIGSTEQHGPTGLIGTDAICGEAVGRKLGEVTGTLVAPTIAVGMAQHHLGFPGSMTLRPSTLIAVVKDNVESLARHGFTHFYFVNGHGGNVAPFSAAFSELYAESSLARPGNRPPIRCKLRNWYESAKVKAISRELYGDSEGSHATPSEVALTWAVYPQAVRKAKMEPEVAPRGEFTDAADYRRNFPDGRIGSNPNLASIEAGQRLWDAAVADLAEDLKAFVKLAAG
ncbi:MAG: creatininase family protein [Tagaea sp.]|nr:creatininase family protein [Azospirillum sp.]MCA3267016.1 creatininase family protein [Azospirillum sp.]MCZ8125160.1 creatininase family protein [Magnetospirillum sp.]